MSCSCNWSSPWLVICSVLLTPARKRALGTMESPTGVFMGFGHSILCASRSFFRKVYQGIQ